MLGCTRQSRRPATTRRLAATVALTLGLVAIGAGAAWAHSGLVGTDPADRASLDVAPAQVVLTFNEPPQTLGTQVQVLDPNGNPVSSGQAAVTDTQITQPLGEARPAGTYTVQWRMTSADGHPLSGQYTFTATSAVGTTSDDPAETPGQSAAPAPPTSAPTLSPTQGVGAGEDTTAWRWGPDSVTALAVVGALAAGLLVLVVILRRKVFRDDPPA